MQIRVGYEMIYECPQPTPMILTVNLHYTRASDIVIPLIPILLATVLAAGPLALGLIEGVADAVASLLNEMYDGRPRS